MSWVKRAGALLSAAALAVVLCETSGADGQARVEYEPASGLYAASEAGSGGRLLYQKLFANGWPTTREFRQMTQEDNEGAFVDGVGAFLASGAGGVPLDRSFGENEAAKAANKPTVDAIRDRMKEYAKLTGLQTPPADTFMPVFLPFHIGNPSLLAASAFDEAKLETWAWDPKGNTNREITLDSLGFSIYAQALLAEEQLTVERSINVGGAQATAIGRNEQAGFVAFCGLECAVAALNELREKLCQDSTGANPVLGKSLRPHGAQGPGVYDREGPDKRKTYFPHSVTVNVAAAKADYALKEKKSYMFDQAALLLGVSELAKACEGKTGVGRFFSGDKKLLDPKTPENATETAVFLFAYWSVLHFSGIGSQCWGSFATPEGVQGTSVFMKDDGLMLCALEAFLSLKWDTATPLGKRLVEMQEAARVDLLKIANLMGDLYQKSSVPPDGGMCDSYQLANGGPAATAKGGGEARSLGGEGFAVQGLLAAGRAIAADPKGFAGKNMPTVAPLDAARKVLGYLESKRWSAARGLYVDDPSAARGPVEVDVLDSSALLGALRACAQDTKDVRYLLRYKSYLASLRAGGIPLSQTLHGAAPPAGARTVPGTGYAPVAPQLVQIAPPAK